IPGQPNTLHRYAYAFNNPVNYVDPAGTRSTTLPFTNNVSQPRSERQDPAYLAALAGWLSAPGRAPRNSVNAIAQGVSRWVSRSDVFARQQSQGHRPLLCGILGALNNAQNTGKNLYDTLKQYVDPLTRVVADILSPLAGTALGRQMAAVVYDARLWAQQHQSEIIAAATMAAAVGIVGVATAAVILTGGAAAIPMTILAGALIGGTAGAAGQLVQDLITGQKPRLENYLLPAAVGALGGAAAGLVVLGGGALGLSTVAVGAATGLSVGALSQYAINRLSGQPWHAGVGQMALAGGIGGAVGGLIASRFLSQNTGLATHMLVESLSDALVSAGTQVEDVGDAVRAAR
ncbi:MAG: hypothetical protein P8186_14870, partial [Anaerolineae bacterium]